MRVIFTLVDAAGVSLDTDTANLPVVPARGKALAAPLQIGFDKPAPASMKVAWVVDSFGACSSFSYKGIRLVVSNVAAKVQEYGGVGVTAQVANPSKDVVEYPSIVCVLRTAGAITGGASTSITDPIVPGGSVAWETSESGADPKTDAVECEAYA